MGTLLLCLALCVLAVFLVGRASAQEITPLPLDILLLIDHSNSMWDKDGIGSDPDLLRVEAANLFIAYLGVDTARVGNRLGVVHFGGHSELVVPLTPLDSAEQRQAIRAAIANPRRMDWTDPLEALQLAYATLFPTGRRDPMRQPVVILLTDGKLETSPNPSQEERAAYVAGLRALVDRFREQGCPIFTIALSNEATDADPEIQTVYRNLWQEIAARTPPAEYHQARTAGDLPRIYHAVVASLFDVEAGEPVVETSVDGDAMEIIAVEPGLAQVMFVVLRSDPALQVRLLRPGGAPARIDDPDVRGAGEPGVTREQVWMVTDPRPGRWSLELQGRGTVTVWQDTIPENKTELPTYTIEMTPPLTYVLAGRAVDIAGISVVEASAQEPVKGAVIEQDLQIIAEVYRAGFAEATFLAWDDGRGCDTRAGDGRYCAVLPDPPPGACTLLVRALLDGAEVARREIAFEVGGAPFKATALPPATPVSSLAAPVSSLTVPVSLLTAPVSGASRGKAQETRFFPKNLVSPPRWILPLVGLVGLVFLGTTGGVLVRRRQARVTLDGSLRVLAAPPGEPAGAVLDIPACPSVVLGGVGKHTLPLPRPSTACSTEAPGVTLWASRTPEGDVETWVAPLANESSNDEGDVLLLNDHSLKAARRLHDSDVLTVGDYRLRYESLVQAGARRARHRPRHKTNWIGGMK